ncbi:hypothetical protein HK097_009151 [Rhizophlyctis rosea]|uniref:Heterokaryon incompatibility domain-containing protein n=1 Tax=Rhizophlyctis rosea TaxID=64517 RepID=A0AAD5SBP5_9FUNG|nr:hypothetical protein HK097_009151 [Rhizophlyctis rosea]
MPVWFDIYSINQNDKADIETQALAMFDIFKNASQTLIVLPCRDIPNDMFPFTVDSFFGRLATDYYDKKFRQEFEARVSYNMERNLQSNLFGYHSRVWTLQEHLLANNPVYVCECGECLDYVDGHALIDGVTAKMGDHLQIQLHIDTIIGALRDALFPSSVWRQEGAALPVLDKQKLLSQLHRRKTTEACDYIYAVYKLFYPNMICQFGDDVRGIALRLMTRLQQDGLFAVGGGVGPVYRWLPGAALHVFCEGWGQLERYLRETELGQESWVRVLCIADVCSELATPPSDPDSIDLGLHGPYRPLKKRQRRIGCADDCGDISERIIGFRRSQIADYATLNVLALELLVDSVLACDSDFLERFDNTADIRRFIQNVTATSDSDVCAAGCLGSDGFTTFENEERDHDFWLMVLHATFHWIEEVDGAETSNNLRNTAAVVLRDLILTDNRYEHLLVTDEEGYDRYAVLKVYREDDHPQSYAECDCCVPVWSPGILFLAHGFTGNDATPCPRTASLTICSDFQKGKD